MMLSYKAAFFGCAVLVAAGNANAEMSAPTEEELSSWADAFDRIEAMEPKWAVQGIEAFKNSSDAGVPIFYLDVRTPAEWEDGIVQGAVKATLTDLTTEDGMALLPDETNSIIAIYCKSGHRSALAVPFLQRLGYVNAISMRGGYEAWVEAGYPINAGGG